MFIEIESVNRVAPGSYAAKLLVYGSSEAEHRALVYSYTRTGDSSPCACDLVVHSAGEGVYVRDFERRLDGCWRDSDGNVSKSLNALLPAEVRTLLLEQVFDLRTIEVTA